LLAVRRRLAGQLNSLIALRHVVDGRELHAFLESRRQFADWITQRIAKYGFVENQDFARFSQNCEKPQGGRPSTAYILSLDMAKELSMVENNARGREARCYFIEMERRALATTAQPNPASAIQAEIARQVEAAIDAKLGAPEEPASPDAPDTHTPVFSMTEGLQRHGSDLSAVFANRVMMACGWMADCQHVTVTGKLVQYKVLLEDGLAFGANVTNYMQPDTTTPYYYADSFPQLLQLIEDHRHLVFDFADKPVSEMSRRERDQYKVTGERERRKEARRERRREELRQRVFRMAREGRAWSSASKSAALHRHFTSEERRAMKAEFKALQATCRQTLAA